jgi:membrane protease subunit HflC
MNRFLLPAALVAFALVFVASQTFFIVPQTHQAIVLQFGNVQSEIKQPGLYVKVPFVQTVEEFDKRNIGFTLAEQTITGADQERLVVDAFARYRITEPLKFYQQVRVEQAGEARLRPILEGVLRRVLGAVATNEIIGAKRAELMRMITSEMNKEASAPGGNAEASLGVEIIDVRIRQADFVAGIQERVFERMRTDRQRVAGEIRAKGQEEGTKIRAEAERQATILRAEATEQAQKIKGDGDAERAKQFAASFGRDPDFAGFYRAMQAYEKAIPAGTQMIVPPQGEFFRYMNDKSGATTRR